VGYRGVLIVVGIASGLVLLAAAPALAGTEVGSACEANEVSVEARALISLANPAGSPLPAVVPQAGVITGWRSRVSSTAETFARVKVVRPVDRGAAGTGFQVIAQSEPEPLTAGTNSFSTRIPVQAGDLVGLSGDAPGHPNEPPSCEEPGGRVEALEGDPPVGAEASEAFEFVGHQVPLVAIVEPDVDRDGFGDETQDLCPQSAATQSACPRPSLLLRARAGPRSATLFVSCSAAATVSVVGSVRLGRGRQPLRLKAPAQALGAGGSTRFVLRFPAKLRARLARLRPKHWLRMRIAASATNGVGESISGTAGVRLTGRPSG
jgi:hypothetical protein